VYFTLLLLSFGKHIVMNIFTDIEFRMLTYCTRPLRWQVDNVCFPVSIPLYRE